ncbi:hypothetical protein B0H21DRAFT_66787 [Amylocystis lapponica]|nr:hypothetical protein B0H21DRAFT_66787 [Amylocystis lapponica]
MLSPHHVAATWFVLFDVSRYLSPEEREELDEGLISGKSIEEWEKLGYAIPMLKKYDDYLQDLYNLFCLRWRRVFARARFEVWKHGFEDLQLYKQECSESEFYETEKDIKKDHEFSRLGTELERQTNGEGLPSSFRLPFLDIVNAIRRGAMCCARERLETFQRGLPASGEVGLDHTTIGLSTFLASSGPQTDAEAKRR